MELRNQCLCRESQQRSRGSGERRGGSPRKLCLDAGRMLVERARLQLQFVRGSVAVVVKSGMYRTHTCGPGVALQSRRRRRYRPARRNRRRLHGRRRRMNRRREPELRPRYCQDVLDTLGRKLRVPDESRALPLGDLRQRTTPRRNLPLEHPAAEKRPRRHRPRCSITSPTRPRRSL